jgi:phosphatidate cytidylyltransferase
MSPRERGLWLFGGVVVLLLLASVIGAVLRSRAQPKGGSATIDNLIARVNAWWVMVAVFGVTLLLGRPATLVLFGICSFFTLREFVTLTPTRPGDYWPLVLCFYVVLPVQYVLLGYDAYGTFAIFIPVYAFLLLPAIAAVAGETDGFLERTAKVQWGLMITVYCISYAPALLMLRIQGYEGASALLLFYLVLIAQLSDVLQYVFGKLFGRTKLAPRVSPSKTVAGLIGGGLSATLIGGALYWVTPFQWWQSLLLSLVIVVMGFLGGLALSAVKRSIGAKDWGVMIEGHGGMLDRFDSVCFAAPVFFHLVRYFYT